MEAVMSFGSGVDGSDNGGSSFRCGSFEILINCDVAYLEWTEVAVTRLYF